MSVVIFIYFVCFFYFINTYKIETKKSNKKAILYKYLQWVLKAVFYILVYNIFKVHHKHICKAPHVMLLSKKLQYSIFLFYYSVIGAMLFKIDYRPSSMNFY